MLAFKPSKIIKGFTKPDIQNTDECVAVYPLPVEITSQIPYEIYECFIQFLKDDVIALRACSLVCRGWKQNFQPVLFRLLLRPRSVTNPRFKFKDKVQCAVIHEPTKTVLYGTDQGMYWSNLDHPEDSPVKVMVFLNIKQVDIMTLNGQVFVILLANGCLYKSPLDALDPSRASMANPGVQAWPSDMEFYAVGKVSDVEVIAVVRKKKHKLLRCSAATGDFTVHAHYSVSHPTSSLYFLKRRIVAIHPMSGFSVISLRDMTSVIIPDSSVPEFKFTKSAKALAMAAVDDHFILCFDKFAFYVDQQTKRMNDTLITWCHTPHQVVFHRSYILAFSTESLEIRRLRTGALHQLIHRKFRLLSGPTSSRVVVMRDDGRIFALKK